MHDIDWLNDGTAYWKRDDGQFTVVPAAEYVLGMINPTRLVENNFDIYTLLSTLKDVSDSFGYDLDLVWDVSVRRNGAQDEKEMNYFVSSSSKKGVNHVVTLYTIADETDDMRMRYRSLKNLEFIDHCESGQHKGRLCSMPFEACKPWYVTKDEWEKAQNDTTVKKKYGFKLDKHVVSTIRDLDLYPVFDERRFQTLLPAAIKTMNNTPKMKGKGKKKGWYMEDLDRSLKPILNAMGFRDLVNYYKFITIVERHEEKLFNLYNDFPRII